MIFFEHDESLTVLGDAIERIQLPSDSKCQTPRGDASVVEISTADPDQMVHYSVELTDGQRFCLPESDLNPEILAERPPSLESYHRKMAQKVERSGTFLGLLTGD